MAFRQDHSKLVFQLLLTTTPGRPIRWHVNVKERFRQPQAQVMKYFRPRLQMTDSQWTHRQQKYSNVERDPAIEPFSIEFGPDFPVKRDRRLVPLQDLPFQAPNTPRNGE
jgi:hypothetical protein